MNSATLLRLTATFLVIETTSAQEVAGASSDFVVRSWTSAAGLPEMTVNAITQTKDGFLWVGTNGGLGRFDGIGFRNYGLQDGLHSIWVLSLAEDRQGNLWIGTVGGGLSCWDKGKLTTMAGPEEGIPEGADILTLAADADGSLWIGTENGLLHRSGGKITPVGEAQGVPAGQVRALMQDSRGTVWAAVLGKGLYRGNGGKFVRIEKPAGGAAPGGVNSLVEAPGGAILAATQSSIWRQSGDVWEKLSEGDGVPKTTLTTLALSSGGITWAGTRTEGLHQLKGGRFEPVVTRKALDVNYVLSIFADRQGLIWVGTSGAGLYRLAPRVMQFQSEESGLPGAITSLAEDASGAVWAATAEGLYREREGRFRKITKQEEPEIGSDSRVLYCAATAGDGSIWIAGEGCALRFAPGQPMKRFTDAPLKNEAIRALCADGNAMWMGTYYAGLLKGDAGGVRTIAPDRTFPGGITSLAVEAEDILWVGTSQGLHRWEKGKVRTWNTKDGLLTAHIRAIHRDPDGTLWLGTLGGGLVRMKDGKFTHFTMRQGLIQDSIAQIVADDHGCLWLAANLGLMCLERRELEAVAEGKATELHPMVFGRQEGLLMDKCAGGTSPTAIKTKAGRLLFPAGGGIAGIDPLRLKNLQSVTDPQPIIQDLVLDRQPHPPNEPLVVPPGNHRLEISYTAPVLRGGEWVRFRHKLDGLDKNWVPAGRQRLASYDGLQPGHYVFHLSAADGSGNWNESPTTLAITVQPIFWQTAWFRIGGIILLAGLSGGAAWWHTHRKHARQMEVVESERKLQAQLAHLSRISSLGELSGSLAHELNQPLGIILANAQAAQRLLAMDPPDISEVRAILKDIVAEDKRGGEVIKRLRDLLKRGETKLVPVFIHEIIKGVLSLLHSDLIGRAVTVRTELADGAPCVPGDQVELQQVLINLIMNACDAMAENAQAERIIRIFTNVRDGLVTVAVEDQGCGLPEGAPARIFEPFFTTKAEGMGIGLSICRSIINAHHGRLWAEPNPEGGATFFVELEFIVLHS